MKLSLALTFLVQVHQVQVLVGAQEPPFNDCSVETYYQDMPTNVEDWTRELVSDLIQTSHRNVPVFTNPTNPPTTGKSQMKVEILNSIFLANCAGVNLYLIL